MTRLPIALCAVFLTGCSTILAGNDDEIRVTSVPNGQSVSVYDEDGDHYSSGITPFTLHVDTGDGYFDGASYTLKSSSGQVQAIDTSLDATYLLNVLLTPISGGLLIDPLTGAMWRFSADSVELR